MPVLKKLSESDRINRLAQRQHDFDARVMREKLRQCRDCKGWERLVRNGFCSECQGNN